MTKANTSRKSAMAVVGAALVALTLSSCAVDASPGSNGGSAPQAKDGITIICGNVEDLCEFAITKFTEDTGIPANYVRLSGGEILARLESTAGSATAEFDAWWGGPVETYVAAAERNLLEKYDSPARANILPDLIDSDGFWSGYSINPIGLCSSKSKLEELGVGPLESWEALLNPALKQNVSTSHPATSGTGAAFVASLVAALDGVEPAFEFMTKLHPNVLQYTKSGAAPVQMLVRKEVATAVAYTSVCERERLVNGNDDLVMTWPKEGVGFEAGGVGVVKGVKNLAGAQAFVDWALSERAYVVHSESGYHVFPPFKESKVTTALDVDLADIPMSSGFDPVKAGEQRSELAERFDREIAPAPVE